MSIEQNLASIAESLSRIASALESNRVTPTPQAAPVQTPAPTPAPVIPKDPVILPAVTAQPAPVVAAPEVSAPVTTGVTLPGAAQCPIKDTKTLIAYVMEAYQQLGPQKGAAIQNVLVSLGVSNINDVKPESYVSLWQQVEALRGA